MRAPLLLVALLLCIAGASAQPPPQDPYDVLKSLAGEWQADLPPYGKINNSIRLVSNGTAIEETIGTPADNEVSLYTRDGKRILLTHFCALTPGGHQVRLETSAAAAPGDLDFGFVGAINLPDGSAPHMRRMLLSVLNRDHLIERWTKTENGTETTFDLHFVRL